MTSFTACFNEKEPFAVMQKENNVRFSENSLQSCSLSAAERQHFPSSGRLVGSSVCFFAWRQHDEGFLETDGNCLFTFWWQLHFLFLFILEKWWMMWPWQLKTKLLVYLISKLSKLFNVYILVYDEEDFLQGSVLNHGRIFVFPLLDYLRPHGKTPTTKHIF